MADDDLRRVFDELRELRELMERMLEDGARPQPRAPEPVRADDLVDADYFARATGLSRVTILQGKAGAGSVPRASKRPPRWRKADVDRFVRLRAAAAASPQRKAFKLLERRGGRSPAA